jgi:GH15 family glucan-1,4-alpha-glucosidase
MKVTRNRKPTYPAIADLGIIGDCRSAALVAKDGTIDWLCWPKFDSPSIFGSLLDAGCGGFFAIRPTGPYDCSQRYLESTNVLETTFKGASGTVTVTDCMPVASEHTKRGELWPEHQLIRMIEGVSGELELEITCAPRPQYARVVPRLQDRGFLGFYYESGSLALGLRSDLQLELSKSFADVHGVATIRAGERRAVSLVLSDAEPGVLASIGEEAERKIALSKAWWGQWIARCEYDGPYQEPVRRSALALKLLCFAPSGALVAAPSTSLPEKVGGIRNWDYRYCWLRDASLTVQALFDLGYSAEAEAFLNGLIHTTRVTAPELQILYTVYGEPHVPEQTLDHLEGYAGSRPVRIGNDAHRQFQLDVYGEVVDAAHSYAMRGGKLDRTTSSLLTAFGSTVCQKWREPDQGIWEHRAEPQHHTHSKVMCWVALDRLIRLHEHGQLKVPLSRFAAERDAIRETVERRSWNPILQTYTSVFDGDDVDANLLLLGRYGFADPGSDRMQSTMRRIGDRLGADGLIYRYPRERDNLPPGEGAFGICSFWMVSCQALAGDIDGATRRFEDLLGYANDLGLYAEEIEPETHKALGNFPQAFTHVGLIDAALTLQKCRAGEARAKPVSGHAKGRV